MLYSQYECTCHHYVYRYQTHFKREAVRDTAGIKTREWQRTGAPICVWHRAPQELNPALIWAFLVHAGGVIIFQFRRLALNVHSVLSKRTFFEWSCARLSSPCGCVVSYVPTGSHDSLATREMMTSRVADVTSVCGLTMTNMVRWLSAVVTWSMLESWNALFDILLLMLCCGRKKVSLHGAVIISC